MNKLIRASSRKKLLDRCCVLRSSVKMVFVNDRARIRKAGKGLVLLGLMNLESTAMRLQNAKRPGKYVLRAMHYWAVH